MATMSDTHKKIIDPEHHTSLMASLRTFTSTESFTDVVFVCQDGHKVYAHKLILISVSYVLRKLVTENPCSNEMITIHLPDINSKDLRIIIHFLYTGFIQVDISKMDQFKMILDLLNIELFQKNPGEENSTNSNAVNGKRCCRCNNGNINRTNNAPSGSNNVQVNNIAQLPSAQATVRKTVRVKNASQQTDRLVPAPRNQPVLNNTSFSNVTSETSRPNNSGTTKRKSENPHTPFVYRSRESEAAVVIDLTEDDVSPANLNQLNTSKRVCNRDDWQSRVSTRTTGSQCGVFLASLASTSTSNKS